MRKNEEQLKLLEQGFERMRNSDEYRKYLETMGRFHKYSARNCLLILMQKPEATRCASYTDWQKMKRQVIKGETGIKIIRPVPRKKTVVNAETGEEETRCWTSFSVGCTFDISQTEGEPLPEICHILKGDVADFPAVVKRISSVTTAKVAFEDFSDAANGYYSRQDHKIVVKASLPQAQQIKTLCHEVAHSLLHCEGGKFADASQEEKELQAESVAYVVCHAIGIDSAEYTFGYLVGWSGGERKRFEKVLAAVHQCASEIIDKLEKGEGK